MHCQRQRAVIWIGVTSWQFRPEASLATRPYNRGMPNAERRGSLALLPPGESDRVPQERLSAVMMKPRHHRDFARGVSRGSQKTRLKRHHPVCGAAGLDINTICMY